MTDRSATARTLGVDAVRIVDRVRRPRFGRAVTGAAIEAGRSASRSDGAIRQSTEMGGPVQRSMGFATVGAIVTDRRQSG
jgi:hypothetical protein